MIERERQAILFANEAFYAAFTSGDLAAMDGLWAPDPGIACIHPGWAPLTDRTAIMESWAAILESPPPVHVRGSEVFPLGAGPASDVAFVLCYEVIGADTLVATNIYRKLADGWKIQHHQAGPCPPQNAPEREDAPQSVN